MIWEYKLSALIVKTALLINVMLKLVLKHFIRYVLIKIGLQQIIRYWKTYYIKKMKSNINKFIRIDFQKFLKKNNWKIIEKYKINLWFNYLLFFYHPNRNEIYYKLYCK